jgi:hypothetical protein
MIWSSDDEKKLLKAVSKAVSTDGALQSARMALGRNVTLDSIRWKLRQMGKPSLGELVAKNAPATPVQALADHRERDRVGELTSAKKELLKELDDKDRQLEILSALAGAPLKPVVLRSTKGKNPTQRQGVPVLLCSDWHVEEPVELAKVNGMNEYNLEIADRCIDKMAEAFTWLGTDKRYDMRTAVIWLGGDLYSGYIHEELVEGNFLSPVEAVLWLQERIEKMLRKIAAENPNLERILVPCNDGNHGRLTHKIRVSSRTANSLEWLLYQNLARRLSDDKRFEFQVADGEWTYVDIFDQTIAFTHGDTFRYQGGVGGISIPLRRGINEMRKYRKITQTCLGHFHQRCDFGDINVNGSMIGVNTYGMHIHAPPEPRQQSWFLIDQTRGKALSAPVWL